MDKQTLELIQIKEKRGLSTDRSRLYVFFTGGWDQAGGYDFEKSGDSLPYPCLYVRDLAGDWYRDGFIAAAQDLKNRCEEYLRCDPAGMKWIPESFDEECFTEARKKIVFVGLSMGGYAALKFGQVCQPDKIVAFAPLIEWPGVDNCIDAYGCNNRIPIDVHICDKSNQPLDLPHAIRLEQMLCAKVIVHECSKHNVSKILKDRGMLMDIIKEAI